MHKIITAEEAVKLTNQIFVDVRSESEFAENTYPGAVNLPVLNDQERVQVGTIYHQVSPQAAKIKALEIIAPKLPGLVAQIAEWSKKGEVVLFCWRGGMRSQALATVCDLMGIPVRRLAGGLKGYRRFVNAYLNNLELQAEIVVLHGLTGVGKTDMLKELSKLGVATIDLEGLAHNRGSVFGDIGMPPPPSQKSFEAALVQHLIRFAPERFIVVECESRRIGRNVIPERFFAAMQAGRHILLYDTLENRINRLVKVYVDDDQDNLHELQAAVTALEKRLGKKKVAELNELIRSRDFTTVVKVLLLEYYDPLYNYPSGPSPEYELCVDAGNIQAGAAKINEYLNSVASD